ncbi:Ras-related protein RABH1b [Vitis vinifera]|uniref:Ras-related protein RABH1b n=1 Tax=Vitis vinifera TaxID=29760 RepID=A0A438JZH1_VITVI|nr:Ras-related protein RABH1b [Vitis vinifera]
MGLSNNPELPCSFCCPPHKIVTAWQTRLRQVSIEEGEAKARELNVMFIETSCNYLDHGILWLHEPFLYRHCFGKIAAALPGMETLSSAKQEDMVDVNLKSSSGSASQSQTQARGCSC